jgi:Ca-activated chloride channel family protein
MKALRFDIEIDRPLVREESGTRYVLARIVAPEGQPRKRPALNLGLVLDRSGSMTGEKIRLAKEASLSALRRLEPRDHVAVVVYDDRVDVVVPATAASPEAVNGAAESLRRVQARGSTDLCGGWLLGCGQVGQVQSIEAVNRVLLLTDGLANKGIVDHSEILRHAAELRARGIATTTIGVGEDFDEHLLGRMADEGGGHFYYVERDDQIPRAIENEVGEALEVTLKGARLRVGPAAHAQVAPIAGFPTRRDGDEWVIELGDLVSQQEVILPLRVSFAGAGLAAADGTAVRLSFAIAAAEGPGTEAVVQWRVASKAEVDNQPRNRKVDRAVAEAYAAQARQEAGRLNRDGDFSGARRRLERTAARVMDYAGDDTVLKEVIRRLERDAAEYAEQMSASRRKAAYMASYAVASSRAFDGSSRRAPRPEKEEPVS